MISLMTSRNLEGKSVSRTLLVEVFGHFGGGKVITVCLISFSFCASTPHNNKQQQICKYTCKMYGNKEGVKMQEYYPTVYENMSEKKKDKKKIYSTSVAYIQ